MPKVEFLTRQQKRERTVDEIIDIYRKRKHITKSDLAKKINMPRSTFNVKVSKNQGEMKLKVLWGILDVLEVPAEERAKILL